ncbi:MAG: hypothetical protein ACJAX5_001751 [Patiriisocius sp.]|jgi:hypothetical protein
MSPDATPCKAFDGESLSGIELNRSTVAARRKRADNDEPPRRSRSHALQPRALKTKTAASLMTGLTSRRYALPDI